MRFSLLQLVGVQVAMLGGLGVCLSTCEYLNLIEHGILTQLTAGLHAMICSAGIAWVIGLGRR